MKALMPLAPLVGSVTAITTTASATAPCVMKHFVPLITHSPPSSFAFVRSPPESEPAPGSVSAHAASASPLTSRGRYFILCSSVPFS